MSLSVRRYVKEDFFKIKVPLASYFAVFKVLKSGTLTQGRFVSELEKRASDLHGWKYGIAVSSGTAALHLSLIDAGVKELDEVILSAYSFVASANTVELCKAKPLFCDTEDGSFLTSFETMYEKISSSTKAIMPIYEFGSVFSEEVTEIKNKDLSSIAVVHDAACAFGVRIDELTHFGTNYVCYSFHPRKIIYGGEGGMILTNDEIVASRLRRLRNHGFSLFNDSRQLIEPGFNYRMDELSAALILSQLRTLPKLLKRRKMLAEYFEQNCKNSFFQIISNGASLTNYQSLILKVKEPIFHADLIEFASKFGLRLIKPAQFIPNEQFYRIKYAVTSNFPNASVLEKTLLALPFSERMRRKDAASIVEVLNAYEPKHHS